MYFFFGRGGVGAKFVLYFFIGLLKHEVLKMHTHMYRCITYFNCLNQNWASEIALSGFVFLVFLGRGVSLTICDEPKYKNVDIPSPLLRHIYIYLFIRTKRGIMKVKIYKGFTYVHCLFVVAGIGVEER